MKHSRSTCASACGSFNFYSKRNKQHVCLKAARNASDQRSFFSICRLSGLMHLLPVQVSDLLNLRRASVPPTIRETIELYRDISIYIKPASCSCKQRQPSHYSPGCFFVTFPHTSSILNGYINRSNKLMAMSRLRGGSVETRKGRERKKTEEEEEEEEENWRILQLTLEPTT